MRLDRELDRFKVVNPTSGREGSEYFIINYKRYHLIVEAHQGDGWEHVSVHLDGPQRYPNWYELNFVKELFWDDVETVLQYYHKHDTDISKKKKLHLWSKQNFEYELPPILKEA